MDSSRERKDRKITREEAKKRLFVIRKLVQRTLKGEKAGEEIRHKITFGPDSDNVLLKKEHLWTSKLTVPKTLLVVYNFVLGKGVRRWME